MNFSLVLRRKMKHHHQFLFVHLCEVSLFDFAADAGTRLEMSQHNYALINVSKEKHISTSKLVVNKRLRMM